MFRVEVKYNVFGWQFDLYSFEIALRILTDWAKRRWRRKLSSKNAARFILKLGPITPLHYPFAKICQVLSCVILETGVVLFYGSCPSLEKRNFFLQMCVEPMWSQFGAILQKCALFFLGDSSLWRRSWGTWGELCMLGPQYASSVQRLYWWCKVVWESV